MVGATLPEVTILPNYKYAKINLAQKNPSSEFLVNGWAENTIMWFTTKSEDLIGNEKIVNCSDINLDIGEDAYVSIDLMDADWLYFQFSNVDTATPKVELLSLTELGGTSVNKLTSTLVLLTDTTPSLESGFYALDSGIYIGSASPNNLVYSTGELIYYDSTSKIFYGTLKSVSLENGTWTIYQNENIENTLSNSRDKIPSSLAVYNAIQSSGAFYTALENDITFNLDGTISDSTGTLTLTDGFYLTKLVNYVDDNGTNLASALSQNYCYYNASSNRLTLTGLQRGGLISYNTFLSYLDSTNGWFYWNKSFVDVLDTSKIATAITSSSDNTKVAGAKAVYDLVLEKGINYITDSSVRIWDLDSGVYFLPDNCTVYYRGSRGSQNFSSTMESFLVVLKNTGTSVYKHWLMYQPTNATDNYILKFGYTNSQTGYVTDTNILYTDNYSTTEQRIGTWTDGKPLYQIVKTATAPNVTTEGTFVASTTNHGISNIDTIFIDNAFDQTATEHVNLPYSTNAGYNIKATVSTTQIAISSNATNFNGHTFLFILRYTKTTD